MHLEEIWRYPVKSLAGERLDNATILGDGIAGDRVVRVRGATGRRITARQFPRLLGLHGTLADDGEPLVDGEPWTSLAVLAAVRAASSPDVELIRDDSRIRFDVLPISVATDGAVAALGIDVRRLRPNLVLGGVDGLAEREWYGRAIRIGDAVVGVLQVRGRCVMTTYDPETLEQDHGVPQRIVDEYGGRFALDCYVLEPGGAKLGDEVELLGHWTLDPSAARSQLGAVRPTRSPEGQGEAAEEEEGSRRPHPGSRQAASSVADETAASNADHRSGDAGIRSPSAPTDT
ncbi:MAG: MOSC domain-containing protein [Gaiellaceae bacterium]